MCPRATRGPRAAGPRRQDASPRCEHGPTPRRGQMAWGNNMTTAPEMAISDPLRRLGQMRPLHGDHLSLLCDDLFSSFTRADQRRWGEVYVRGLADVPGRKSIRRISQLVVGWRADQRLQQFVNQSPWSWEPVRMRLAHQLTAQLEPVAWVVSEAVFRKNGDLSVGVARQYA